MRNAVEFWYGLGRTTRIISGLFVVMGMLGACSTAMPSEQQEAPVTKESIEKACFSAWDGNHDGFERQIKRDLKDPGSMKTYETRYRVNPDGTWTIFMDYGARNSFGGMVRNLAVGTMNTDTCAVTVITLGE